MGPVCLFAYIKAVILNTHPLSIETVFSCSYLGLRLNDFNFYVMGKKYSAVSTVCYSCFVQSC